MTTFDLLKHGSDNEIGAITWIYSFWALIYNIYHIDWTNETFLDIPLKNNTNLRWRLITRCINTSEKYFIVQHFFQRTLDMLEFGFRSNKSVSLYMSIILNRTFDQKHHKKIFSRKRLSFLKTLPLTKNSYFLHILFDKFHKFPRNKSSNFYWTHIKVLYIWHRMRKFMALYPFRNSLHLYERFAIYDVHKIISNLNMHYKSSSILIKSFSYQILFQRILR